MQIEKGFKDAEIGGLARNRTGVQGFAVLCVTTPPRGLNPSNARGSGRSSIRRQGRFTARFTADVPISFWYVADRGASRTRRAKSTRSHFCALSRARLATAMLASFDPQPQKNAFDGLGNIANAALPGAYLPSIVRAFSAKRGPKKGAELATRHLSPLALAAKLACSHPRDWLQGRSARLRLSPRPIRGRVRGC